MAQGKVERIEVYVYVDGAGDYHVGKDAEAAQQAFTDDIGDPTDGTRVIRVVLDVPLPVVQELRGVVPAQGDAALTSVE